MSNTIGYGQGAVNNTIGFGQGALTGGTPFSNTYSTEYDGIDTEAVGSTIYSELNGNTQMTFSIWIKPTSATTSIISSVEDNGSTEQFRIVFHSSRYIIFRTGTKDTRTANGSITLNVWSHILVCLDYSLTSGSKGKIFINGVDATISDAQNGTALATSGGSLYIAARNISLGSRIPFIGLLDEAAIWSNSDLRNDVTTLYNSGAPNDLNNNNLTAPTSWYRFEEGSGTTIADSGTSSYNLTLDNTVTFETDVPT